MMRPIQLHGQTIGNGTQPLICTPLVGKTAEGVLEELRAVLPKGPDIIEWRVDGFEGIGDPEAVLQVAGRLREAAGALPILFTCRAASEGGQPIPIDAAQLVKLYVAVCAARCVDLIDYELNHPAEELAQLRQASRANDVAMIMSYHNFQATPDAESLVAKFLDAERLGADIAKVAVMPERPGDVLTLLDATWRASQRVGIPLIGLSMGGLGAVSRLAGGVFGSAVTFAIGMEGSAPGQLPIETLRAVLGPAGRSASSA